jgi:hypothetical protein
MINSNANQKQRTYHFVVSYYIAILHSLPSLRCFIMLAVAASHIIILVYSTASLSEKNLNRFQMQLQIPVF